MKLLAFIFLFSTFFLLAEPTFYEGFEDTEPQKMNANPLKEKVFPSPLKSLVTGLTYTNHPPLKTAGLALRVKDGQQTIINIINNENKVPLDVSNSFCVSYLIKLDKIYDKDYSASLIINGNSGSKPLIIDLHRDAKLDSEKIHISTDFYTNTFRKFNFVVKEEQSKRFDDFNKKVVRKNTILVLISFENKLGKTTADILFNVKYSKSPVLPYDADYFLNTSLTNFNSINKIILSAKGADIIFDEIRCGTTAEDVLPVEERKELSEEELLGDTGDTSILTANPNDTFTVSNSFLESIVIIKGGKGVGTGFLAKSGSNDYIYTNVHVLMGNNKMRFINKDGEKIKPVSIETTPGRDVVRLKIKKNKNLKSLRIAKPPGNNTPIAVCGNSGGGGVIRTLHGIIIGSGPDKVETDAKFISGNSGSPIMLENGDVVGIAAYVQQANVNWVNTNTPFTVARRFAYRIDNIDHWKNISPKTFVKEADVLMKREEKLLSMIEILDIWARAPYWNRIQRNDALPRAMNLWIENHNEWVEHNWMRFKHTAGRSANVKNLSRDLINELGGKVEFLKKSFKRSYVASRKRWNVPFFKSYSDDLDQLHKLLIKAIDNIADAATATDPVYLKQNR